MWRKCRLCLSQALVLERHKRLSANELAASPAGIEIEFMRMKPHFPNDRYASFAKFYDAVMGDRTGPAEYLHGLIRRTKPNARKLLELACGTGSMLKHLGRYYEVSGIDLSRHMLSVARRKVPQAKLFQQNMVTFSLPERFDVICCVFDSINHIAPFSDWKKLFANVQRHLLPGGCFIFDINTQRKLDRHIA